MKDKIIMLIIGILIGAIIASACFLLFGKTNQAGNARGGNRPDMENFTPGDMPEGMQGGKERGNIEATNQTNEDTNSL